MLWLLRSGLLLLLRRYLDQSAIRCLTGAVPETTELLSMHWDHIFYTSNVSFFKCDPCLLLCALSRWLLTVVVGCHALVALLEAVVMLAVAGLQSFSSRQTRVL